MPGAPFYTEKIVPFELTSAQLLALDTTAVVIVTLQQYTGFVHFPTRIELSRQAGTAYTLTGDTRLVFTDDDNCQWFNVRAAGLLDSASANGRVQVTDLLAENLGNYQVTVKATTNLASGTGSLRGRMYYIDVPVDF